MKYDPSRVLAIFFEIKPEIIKEDLRRFDACPAVLEIELSSLLKIPEELKTSEQWARSAHLWMIQAGNFQYNQNVEREAKIYVAMAAAIQVAAHAQRAEEQKERLLELRAEMQAICDRLNSKECEPSTRDAEFVLYHEAKTEFETHLAKVEDMIFTTVLDQYGLVEISNLFDADRKEFEIRREVGRHLLNQAPPDGHPMSKEISEGLVRRYGAGVLEDVLDRVVQIRASQTQATETTPR